MDSQVLLSDGEIAASIAFELSAFVDNFDVKAETALSAELDSTQTARVLDAFVDRSNVSVEINLPLEHFAHSVLDTDIAGITDPTVLALLVTCQTNFLCCFVVTLVTWISNPLMFEFNVIF